MIDFKKELFFNAYKNRIPLTATIEIISECNFRCVHCYIDSDCRKNVLSYEQVVDFGNQIIDMGCLYVILTGGEVLLHPDFKKIYSFFAQKGICVSVFTNGSLINDDVIDLFIKYPPRVVEVTMYGFSPIVYQQVTNVPKYEQVKNNVLLLKHQGINVLLKMFVLAENHIDFEAIHNFALENEIPFKYDTMIIAGADVEESKHQLRTGLVLDLESSKYSTAVKYNEDTYNFIIGKRHNKLFQCGAGRSSCWLKSNNRLRICNFLSCLEFDLTEYTVYKAWQMMAHYIDGNISEKSKCYNCDYRNYCSYCPAISYTMYQRMDMIHPNPIYCQKAMVRALDEKGG